MINPNDEFSIIQTKRPRRPSWRCYKHKRKNDSWCGLMLGRKMCLCLSKNTAQNPPELKTIFRQLTVSVCVCVKISILFLLLSFTCVGLCVSSSTQPAPRPEKGVGNWEFDKWQPMENLFSHLIDRDRARCILMEPTGWNKSKYPTQIIGTKTSWVKVWS